LHEVSDALREVVRQGGIVGRQGWWPDRV